MIQITIRGFEYRNLSKELSIERSDMQYEVPESILVIVNVPNITYAYSPIVF